MRLGKEVAQPGRVLVTLLIHTLLCIYIQICSDLCIVYVVCAHKPSDWATFVATARADDPPER